VSLEEWLAVNVARAARALANPAVRAEVLGLMSGDDQEARRRRRREELERELSAMEWRWRYDGSEEAEHL
jgi:hypothetical protein